MCTAHAPFLLGAREGILGDDTRPRGSDYVFSSGFSGFECTVFFPKTFQLLELQDGVIILEKEKRRKEGMKIGKGRKEGKKGGRSKERRRNKMLALNGNPPDLSLLSS
ncbi:uncharacterized protein RHO17_008754 isoform 2-T7 [Thomomys bottae]